MCDNSDKISCDPLEGLHCDIFDLIFQHLSWRDVLTASTVNSFWYGTIAVSPKCMDKLKLNIPMIECGDLQQMYANVMSSERQYRNIYADFLRLAENNLQVLSAPQLFRSYQNWRNVHILNGTFEDESFLGIFHASVENLSLQRVTCGSMKNIIKKGGSMTFPKLKKLKLFSCNRFVAEHFASCTKLEQLQFSETVDDFNLAKESFASILINNKGLEQLTIYAKSCHSLLSQQVITQFKFHLKHLVIETFDEHSTADFRRCLREFLASQASSLEVVDINGWNGAEVLETCLKMPRLKNLSYNVKHSEYVDWTRVKLPINNSITRFNLRDILPHESFDFLNTMFAAVPKLRIYKAENMRIGDLVALSSRCLNLEELYIENFDVEQLPNENCLPRLKQFKSWDVSDELLKSLKSRGAKNLFEELILIY